MKWDHLGNTLDREIGSRTTHARAELDLTAFDHIRHNTKEIHSLAAN